MGGLEYNPVTTFSVLINRYSMHLILSGKIFFYTIRLSKLFVDVNTLVVVAVLYLVKVVGFFKGVGKNIS